MELRKMGQIWTKHYGKHHSNPDSQQICMLICSFVRSEATQNVGNLRGKLAKILDDAGIPIVQFDECDAEPCSTTEQRFSDN